MEDENEKVDSSSKAITPQEAQAVLNQAAAMRLQSCQRGVQAILAQYGFRLMARAFLTPEGRVAAQVVYMPVDNQQARN